MWDRAGRGDARRVRGGRQQRCGVSGDRIGAAGDEPATDPLKAPVGQQVQRIVLGGSLRVTAIHLVPGCSVTCLAVAEVGA